MKKQAIKNIRYTLADLTAAKCLVMERIHTLRLDVDGNRRPETGPVRDQLWKDYTWQTRPLARCAHLALGVLKGTPYSAMEPRHAEDNPPPLYGVLKAIHAACGDDEELIAEWTLERLQGLVEAKPEAKEAA